jgi:hypothetical protein
MGIIGRGQSTDMSSRMPTQAETIAAMAKLREEIANPPLVENIEIVPVEGRPPLDISHDARAGHLRNAQRA